MTKKINLSTVADVKKFVGAASRVSEKIELISGKYVVDAKSIMGVFSLDLTKPVEMITETENAEFINAIEEFLA